MKQILAILLSLQSLFGVLAYSSTHGHSTIKVQAVAYQAKDKALWSLVSMDGKILFQNRFNNEPTRVRDGRFFVKNEQDFWELYDASHKPRRIGGSFLYVSSYNKGYAFVTPFNQPVQVINTAGITVKVLDSIAGKRVNGVYAHMAFSEENSGYAIVEMNDETVGMVDEKGRVVIPPLYCDISFSRGVFLAVPEQYKEFLGDNEGDKLVYHVLDEKGNLLFKISDKQYQYVSLSDGKVIASMEDGEQLISHVFNTKGEKLLEVVSRLGFFQEIKGDKFILYDVNEDRCCLINFKGDTLIRPNYSQLYFDSDRIVGFTEKGGVSECHFFDQEANYLNRLVCDRVDKFKEYDGLHTFAHNQVLDRYTVVNKYGHQVKGFPQMVNRGNTDGDDKIEDDQVNFEQFLSQLNFQADGIDGFRFDTSPQVLMEQLDAKCGVNISLLTGDSLMAASDFRPEKGEDSLIYYENGQRVAVADTTRLSMKKPLFFQNIDKFCYGVRPQLLFPTIFVGFDGKLAQKPSSAATAPYQWSNAKVKYFGLCVENLHKMKGKLHLLFNALATRLSQMGTEVKGNNGAKVYQLRNGKRAFLAMEPQRVFVLWGDIRPAHELDVAPYQDVQEDLGNSSMSNWQEHAISPTDLEKIAGENPKNAPQEYPFFRSNFEEYREYP